MTQKGERTKEFMGIFKARAGIVSQKKIGENIFDIYLMDLKYVSSEKSLKYSGAADYFADLAGLCTETQGLSECGFSENRQ